MGQMRWGCLLCLEGELMLVHLDPILAGEGDELDEEGRSKNVEESCQNGWGGNYLEYLRGVVPMVMSIDAL